MDFVDLMALISNMFFYGTNGWTFKINIDDCATFFADEVMMHGLVEVIAVFCWANGEPLNDMGIRKGFEIIVDCCSG